MRDPEVVYKLHMYGGDRIEDKELYFERLEPAVGTVEMTCTDDTNWWEFDDENARLIDYNNGDAVINKIYTVHREDVDQEIHPETVF